MRSRLVIIANVLAQYFSKMSIIEYDDLLGVHRFQRFDYFIAVDAISIPNHKPGCSVERESLRELQAGPLGTVKKSIATISAMWFLMNVRHV